MPPPPDPRSRADANCDGYVTGGDISYLVQYFSGQVPAPGCCFWKCNDTLTTYYIYSGDQVIAEYNEDGNLIDNYVYLGRMRLARFNDDRKQYYLNDIRGSVAMILDTMGVAVTEMEYYPFGSVLTQTGESHLKYTGKELDQGYDFELCYYGARYYNAEWGRFISPDPVREYYNLYSYCANNPIMFTDPGGEGIVADILGTTGSYLGAMIGARLTPSNPMLGGSIGAAVGYAVGWGAGRGLEMIAEDWCFDVTPALHGPSNNPYP